MSDLFNVNYGTDEAPLYLNLSKLVAFREDRWGPNTHIAEFERGELRFTSDQSKRILCALRLVELQPLELHA